MLAVNADGRKGFRRIDEVGGLRKRLHGKDADAFDDGSFAGIRFRHDYIFDAAVARGQCCGKRAANRAHASIKGKLAEKNIVIQNFAEKCALAAEQPERNGKIERRAFLAHVRRRQIHGDGKMPRKIEAAILERGARAFAAFLHGNVRQTDDIEIARLAGADVHFDFDEVGVDAIHSGAECLKEHREREARPFCQVQDNPKSTSTPQ